MKKVSKFIMLSVIIILSQSALSQSRNCDSIKNVKLTICDMDDITTVFRDRSKFIKLNSVNDSIFVNDSTLISNYKREIKNDSEIILNLKKNSVDDNLIIDNQKTVIKSEQKKTLFWKSTTYISGVAATVFLILTLLK